jgi:hypothetical protein
VDILDKREKLDKILSGDSQIDKDFLNAVLGHVIKREEIDIAIPRFYYNVLRPLLEVGIACENLTEMQILKYMCVEMQRRIDELMAEKHELSGRDK